MKLSDKLTEIRPKNFGLGWFPFMVIAYIAGVLWPVITLAVLVGVVLIPSVAYKNTLADPAHCLPRGLIAHQ
jgi:hypothetical protein